MFTEKQFSIPELKGISAKTIAEHLKLYAGYVKHANLVQEKLGAYAGDESKTYETGELYRHFSFEYNGMRNHEIYFSLLEDGGEKNAPENALGLSKAINSQWGSFENFITQFQTLGLTRGIGWAMLSYDSQTDSLIMHWVDEQHLGQLQGTTPIIALDMWEHSYVADYQPSGKKQYVADFMSNLNWLAAEGHYSAVKHLS